MAGGVVSAKKLVVSERRNLAVELRKSGMSFRQIANAILNELIIRSEPEISAEMGRDGAEFLDIIESIRQYRVIHGKKMPTYTHTTARRDVNAILDAVNAESSEIAIRMRNMMDLQLADLLLPHWESAVAGDIDASNMVLRIFAMRMKLFALDKIDEVPVDILQQNLFVNPLDGLSPSAVSSLIENLALQLQDQDGGNDQDFYQFVERLGQTNSLPSG